LQRTGAGKPGKAAASLLDLGSPRIDWVALAKSLGVPAERQDTAEGFDAAFARAMGQRGPMLIEVALG
jgi:acetolactate synthase-1/2/3 large subunit